MVASIPGPRQQSAIARPGDEAAVHDALHGRAVVLPTADAIGHLRRPRLQGLRRPLFGEAAGTARQQTAGNERVQRDAALAARPVAWLHGPSKYADCHARYA